MGVKLEAVLINAILGQLADDIQRMVEFLVGMAPMRDVCDGGKGWEDDSLFEVVVALEVTAELENVAHRILYSCGLGGVGDGLEKTLQFAAEAVVDGNQVVGVVLVEARHGEIVCGEVYVLCSVAWENLVVKKGADVCCGTLAEGKT